MTGYVLINKPSGPTSHDIINALRRITGVKRIGHAGTLDPFAEGLLFVGVGRDATRNLGKFVGLDKKYRAVLKLGAVSDTHDRTGVITQQLKGGREIDRSKLKAVLSEFIGEQKQTPPMYSAKKIGGKKAYEMARVGKSATLNPQEIEIYDIKIQSVMPFFESEGSFTEQDLIPCSGTVEIDVYCSSGTYIRSLAHDIGGKLGCGAYVEKLQRTAIGNFSLEDPRLVALSDFRERENVALHLFTFTTVMAQGTFEVLHKGHEFYLREAKKLGKRLVVIIARDSTAEKVRGRALRFTEKERLGKVQSLEYVDEAILGDKLNPYASIFKIKPDIIALGYDQKSFVKGLPEKIEEFGLSTKIARIPGYKPEQYKSSLLMR